MNDHPKTAHFLLDHGANPAVQELPVRLATDTDTSTMKMFLDHGLPVNLHYKDVETLLHAAVNGKYSNDPNCESPDCWRGYNNMVRFLLNHGADPNCRDEVGRTPLHNAIDNESADIAMILARAKGADLSLADIYGRSPIHTAIREGMVNLVKYLLSHGVNANISDYDGNTPLHEVAIASPLPQDLHRFIEIARLLINKNANLGAQDCLGQTPLHKVSVSNFYNTGCEINDSIGKFLVEAGAPVNIRDSLGRTPMHEAALWGNAGLVASLLKKGASVKVKDKYGLTPLHLFAAYGIGCIPASDSWIHTAKLLVKAGASFKVTDSYGRTPLWFACNRTSGGTTATILLQCGAPVNDVGPHRMTPLHLAALHNEPYLAEKLMRMGISLNAVDDAGRAPLFYAVINGSLQAANLLLEKGADPSASDSNGNTPLDVAILSGRDDMTALLRRAGAKPGKITVTVHPRPQPHAFNTALNNAARASETDELKSLVEACVSASARDSIGRTALHLVASHYYLQKQLRQLIERKADPNARDDHGMTPLHYAALDGRRETCRILLDAGAVVNAADNQGRTPLHLIPFDNDFISLTLLLLERGADPCLRDSLGRTALHMVANQQGEDRLRFEMLVCYGANPNAKDLFGWTAADLACMNGWFDASPPSCGNVWQKYKQQESERAGPPCLIR
jgi:cytohesin